MGEVFENWTVNILAAWFSGLRILFGKVWKASQYTIFVCKQTKKTTTTAKKTNKKTICFDVNQRKSCQTFPSNLTILFPQWLLPKGDIFFDIKSLVQFLYHLRFILN